MLGITMGAVIGTEVGQEPEPCVIGDIADIQAKVGGHFDCVRADIGSEGGAEFTLVGYVHDEGRIMEPPMELNIMASMIFNQELRGNCVILSGTNPDTKEYDGENYDLPAMFFDFLCKQMTKDIQKSVEFTRMLATSVNMAVRAKKITKEEYEHVNTTIGELSANALGGGFDEMPERCREILERCMQYMVTSVLNVVQDDDE